MKIFASLNYRVNIFGFIQSKEVAAEGSGNFGLLDQVRHYYPDV
jgi:acetylcholinesterase